MSNQRNSNPRYGTGTVSGNLTRAGASGPTSAPQPFQKGYGTGLVSLGTAKKPRTASTLPERKLTVPKPVNLPSLRKENAGNDPNTQLVPSGGGGGWQISETREEPEQELVPNLTAGSSWASAPSASGVPSWQPPQPFPVAVSGPQKARNLNPLEYPSLSAAATAQKQSGLPIQPVPHLPSTGSQGGGNWDEDERKPAFVQVKPTGESWADSKVEDETRQVYRPPWEQNGHKAPEDQWTRSNRPGFGSKVQDRFKEVDDPHLFPPPPPPRQPPPPPPRGSEASREEADAEKRAFEDEIDRVIEDERRRERETALAQEAARQKALEEEEAAQEAAAAAEAAVAAANASKASAEAEAKPLTPEDHQAALEAARAKALAARKRREAEDEELEKRRKEAAARKLQELEERMNARKKAEEEAKQAAMTAAAEATSAEEALQEVHSAVAEAVGSSAESAVSAAKVALEEEMRDTEEIEYGGDKSLLTSSLPSRGDLASTQAEAGSSAALSENLDAFKDTSGAVSEVESIQDYKNSDPVRNGKSGTDSQPKAIWQRRKEPQDSSVSASSAVGSLNEASPIARLDASPLLSPKQESGAAALFGSETSFGPSLVATSLGISPQGLASGQHKPGAKADAKTAAAPSGPLNWRAVMGAKELEELDTATPEESSASREDALAGRGRGRGRRDRGERQSREDGQEPGSRGRGNRERGRGRGRARGRAVDSVGLEGPEQDAMTHTTESSSGATDSRRSSRGRGRARGDQETRGRGRGRGRDSSTATAGLPQPPPPPPSGPRLDSQAGMPFDDELPPGIFSKASLQRNQELDIGAPGLGSSQEGVGWDASHQQDPLLSSLPVSRATLDPPLDSFTAMKTENRHDKAFDRPVDRPKSAAGAVGQPISKQDTSLANGMPNLPHDLALDSLAESSRTPSSSGISFGFPPSQQNLAPGPFPGVFFPGQQQSNPWQQRSSGDSQPNLEAAMQSFYKGGSGSTEHPSPRQAAQQQGSSGLQFGAFGAQSFPQFGQLSSSFGQAPFIHTGKQPDWSTGPSLVNASQSAASKSEGLSDQHSGPEFSRSVGMDAIVQPSSLNKRGHQGAPGHPAPGPPGPPGLQRQTPSSQQQQAPSILSGGLYSNDNSAKSPPPPPGLQNSGAPSSFYNPGRTPRSFGQQSNFGPPQINVSFSGPVQQMQRPGQLPFQGVFEDSGAPQFSQGPPPGIGKAGLSSASQTPQLPDDVFESSTPRGDSSFLPGPPGNSNQQAGRRAPDGRGGRTAGRVPNRGPIVNRGRGYGRMPNMPGGRGSVLPPNLGMISNQGFPHPMAGVLGPTGSAAFPLPPGSMGPIGGFGPNHGLVGDQIQGQRSLGSQSRGRGRGGLRSSQDGGPIMSGTFSER